MDGGGSRCLKFLTNLKGAMHWCGWGFLHFFLPESPCMHLSWSLGIISPLTERKQKILKFCSITAEIGKYKNFPFSNDNNRQCLLTTFYLPGISHKILKTCSSPLLEHPTETQRSEVFLKTIQ